MAKKLFATAAAVVLLLPMGARAHVSITPREFIEVGFVARNPREGNQIVLTLRQRFADGTVTDWTVGPQGPRPTAITRRAPLPRR